jgi:hypothetical protein
VVDAKNFHRKIRKTDERVLKKDRKARRSRGTLLHVFNFGRVHQTVDVTPAVEAGIADHVWNIEEIVERLN